MDSKKLQSWAQLAEICGGLAVLITLIILVFQIGENTRAVRAQTAESTLEQLLDFQAYINETPERNRRIREVMSRDFRGFEYMAQEDRGAAQRIFRRNMYIYDNAYYQFLQGTLDEEVFARYRRAIEGRVARPWFKDYWEEEAFLFSDTFIDYISSFLGEDGSRFKEAASFR